MSAAALLLGAAIGLAAAQPSPAELLGQLDEQWQADASHAVLALDVKTRRFERQLVVDVKTLGSENTRIEVLEPEKEAGTVTLMVGKDAWTLLPGGRTVRLPAAMMGSSWMGSHLTVDDLVKASDYAESFSCVTSSPEPSAWTVRCTPGASVATPWTLVEMDFRKADKAATAMRYFGGGGQLSRTVTLSDHKQVGDKLIPHTLHVVPAKAPEEFTTLQYRSVDLAPTLDPALFAPPKSN